MSSIMRWRKDVAGVGKNGLFIAGRSCSVKGAPIVRAQTNLFNQNRNQPRSMTPDHHAQTSRGAGSFFGQTRPINTQSFGPKSYLKLALWVE
jgi:hypothetical protein